MTDQNKPDDADTDATGSGEAKPETGASETAAERRRRRRAEADAEASVPDPAGLESPRDTGAEQRPRKGFMERRRDKIRAEIERNRRGEYTVPTWVLVVVLIAILVGWAAIIIFV